MQLEQESVQTRGCPVIRYNHMSDLSAWHRLLLHIAVNRKCRRLSSVWDGHEKSRRSFSIEWITLERRSIRLDLELSPRLAASSPRFDSSSCRCCNASMTVRGSGAFTTDRCRRFSLLQSKEKWKHTWQRGWRWFIVFRNIIVGFSLHWCSSRCRRRSALQCLKSVANAQRVENIHGVYPQSKNIFLCFGHVTLLLCLQS